MRVKIKYTGFKLSKDLEFVKHSTGAELFMNDFNIPYVIENDNIMYHMDNNSVIVGWHSVYMFKEMCERYGCEFEIRMDETFITFK